jgi:hypothetical protein
VAALLATAVALWQGSGWTAGILANHIWSFAGSGEDHTESTHDWEAENWSVPLNGVVSKLVKLGGQPVSVFGGVRYWAVSPEDAGPEGWRTRFGITFLFPK